MRNLVCENAPEARREVPRLYGYGEYNSFKQLILKNQTKLLYIILIYIIAGVFGEEPVLRLMLAGMSRASERWCALRVTGFERRQTGTMKRELRQNYKAENDIRKPSADMRQKKLSSIYRT